MGQNNYAYKLINDQTISGLDGEVSVLSNPLDFRFTGGAQQRIDNLIGFGLYHNAAAPPTISLRYVFGVQDETLQRGLTSIYQTRLANDPLLAPTALTGGQLHVVPAPTILMPFLRIYITVANGGVPGVYNLWAYGSERQR